MKRKPEEDGDGNQLMPKRHYMSPPDMHFNTMMPPVQNLQGGWYQNPMNNIRGGGYRGNMRPNCHRGGGSTTRGNFRYSRGNKITTQGRYDNGGNMTSYNNGPYQNPPGYYHPQPWSQGGYGDTVELKPDLASLASVPPPPPGTPLSSVQQQLAQSQHQPPPPPPPPPQSQPPQPSQQQQSQQSQQQCQNQQNQQQNQPMQGIQTIQMDESGTEEFTKTKSSKRRPMSQSYPSRPWNKEAAEKALSVENEYLKGLRSQSLIIRFPDPELSKEVVKKFHPGIENVHFQVPSGPRFCFVQLADDISPDDVIKELQDIKFGAGTLKVEKKITKEEDNLSPEAIDPYTLYIGNLPSNVNIQTVKDKFPTASRIDIGFAQRMKFTRYAFVRYNAVETAIEAFRSTHNLVLDSRSIIVRFRRQRGPTAAPSPTGGSTQSPGTPNAQPSQPEGSPAPVVTTAPSTPSSASAPIPSNQNKTATSKAPTKTTSEVGPTKTATALTVPVVPKTSQEETPPLPAPSPSSKIQIPPSLKSIKMEADVVPHKVKIKKEKIKTEVVKEEVKEQSAEEDDDEDDEDDDDSDDEEDEDDDEEEEDDDDDDDDDEDDDEEEEDDDEDEDEDEEPDDEDDDDDDEDKEDDENDDDEYDDVSMSPKNFDSMLSIDWGWPTGDGWTNLK